MNSKSSDEKHRHETTDARAPLLAWLAAGLALMLVAVQPAIVGVYHWLASVREEQQPVVSPLAVHPVPPHPRLQSSSDKDLQKFRTAEARLLGSYGWVDREHEVVRIPIERAMDLVVERGLPKTPAGAVRPRSKEAEIEEREDTRPATDEPGDKMPAIDEVHDPAARQAPPPKGKPQP